MNRYQPKKCKSPAKAIREFCIECMGGRENDGYLKHIKKIAVQSIVLCLILDSVKTRITNRN